MSGLGPVHTLRSERVAALVGFVVEKCGADILYSGAAFVPSFLSHKAWANVATAKL